MTGEVEVATWTRQVTHVRHHWSEPDSIRWERVQDSVRVAMQRMRGVPMRCAARHRTSTHIRAVSAWRFPDYSVRLVAYKFDGEFFRRWPVQSRWALQLDGYIPVPPDCS